MVRWLDAENVGGHVLIKVGPLVITVSMDVHPLVLFALTQQAKFIAKFLFAQTFFTRPWLLSNKGCIVYRMNCFCLTANLHL